MAVSTGFAAFGGLLLSGLAIWQCTVANEERGQVVALHRQLSSKISAALDVEKLGCTERSQRYFTWLGYDESKVTDDSSTTFQTHYNRRLGRCLMTLEATSYKGGHQVTSKSLIDTDERKTFGEYAWVSSDTVKYYDQKPMQCTMSPPDKDVSYCHSTEDYDAYVKEMLAS